MEILFFGCGARTYIIVLVFGEKFLSVTTFERSFHVFSRFGFKYEKTVGLTLDSFSRPGSNMKREVEFIFRFRTLDCKNENDTECILRCDHAR